MALPSRRFLMRVLRYALAAGVLAVALLVIALRWWLLPEIDQYRERIAVAISKTAGQKVTIGAISADWLSLRPHLKLSQVQIFDHTGHPALDLERVDATLSWTTLFAGELRLYRLEISKPAIDIRRDPDGLIYLSGIVLNDDSVHQDFADWVLHQNVVQINHAQISWRDGLRKAPPLLLNDVGLRLENRGRRHRFGLLASAPPALASTLDIRGQLYGSDFTHLEGWSGQLYADLGYTDLAAWSAWVDLPYHIAQGQGGVRLWTEVARAQPSRVTAQLHLQKVKVQLGKTLPELSVAQLRGRLSWRSLSRGFELQAPYISLDTGSGAPLNVQAIYAHYEAADAKNPEQGELRAQNFSLAPWLALASYLPLSATQRGQLDAWSPQGVFKNLTLSWTGAKASPQSYRLKGEFSDLGLRAVGKLPGFSNLAGQLDANQQGGMLKVKGRNSNLDAPQVFRQALAFSELEGEASWRIEQQKLHLKLAQTRFSNPHLSGSLAGSFDQAANGATYADLQGRLNRADASALYQYLPRALGEHTPAWVQGAVLQGNSDDVKFQLKGPLAQFPYPEDRGGIFRVTATVKQGVLRYAPEWPRIDDITADLDFHGNRMEINARQGKILNAQIARAKIVIPALHHPDPILEVDGEVNGNTSDYLNFIAASPLNKKLNMQAETLHAEGAGKLNLSLRLPLHRLHDTRVAGDYLFNANKLWATLPGPSLEQASGKLSFTDGALNASTLRAQFLGGPLSLTALSSVDGVVRGSATGHISAAALQQAYPGAMTQRLKGGTDWSASLALRKQALNINLLSNLVGLGSDLPYPLNKAANESLPFKFERRVIDSTHDVIVASLGKVAAAQVLRTADGAVLLPEKAQLSFGVSTAVAPTQDGLRVDGELERLDADLWRSLMSADNEDFPLRLSNANIKIKTLDFLGRRFNNFAANVTPSAQGGQAHVESKEMQGDINWSEQGDKISARFKSLVYPEASPNPSVNLAQTRELKLPGLNLIIDDFQMKNLKLGRLELNAVKQNADWHIERLQVKNPDAVFEAQGIWQSWLAQPQTRLTMDLDVKDIGKFLSRMGYPDRIKNGTAKLSGNVNWRGSPQDFNVASLKGDLKLEARRGQFMRLDPGVGKLLGLLSLQSLPRRLTLDFRDVFSEGFAFDNILSVLTVNQGVLASNDFVMQGPAAVVSMSGSTDLNKETQNLRVKVVPVVGDSVSLLAFLGGPVVGLSTFVLQKLLKDPLGKMVAYDYAITGTWENPDVARVSGKTREATP